MHERETDGARVRDLDPTASGQRVWCVRGQLSAEAWTWLWGQVEAMVIALKAIRTIQP